MFPVGCVIDKFVGLLYRLCLVLVGSYVFFLFGSVNVRHCLKKWYISEFFELFVWFFSLSIRPHINIQFFTVSLSVLSLVLPSVNSQFILMSLSVLPLVNIYFFCNKTTSSLVYANTIFCCCNNKEVFDFEGIFFGLVAKKYLVLDVFPTILFDVRLEGCPFVMDTITFPSSLDLFVTPI